MQTSSILNQSKRGKAAAILDGPRNAANIKKILGKNFTVAKYPTITVGGKKVQMEAFLGIEGFAINLHTASAKASVQLAAYITNKKAQLIVHDKAGQIPVLKAAINSSDAKNDSVAEAIIGMAKPSNSVLIPKMARMATFWDGAAPLISGAYDGKIKPAQYKARLDKLAKKVEKE